MKHIGYHTRLYSNSIKVVGGSFGGSMDIETVNRLIKSHFTVVVKKTGTPVFVDREGREVTLYVTVDVGSTEKGIQAMKEYRVDCEKREKEAESRRESEKEELDQLMDGLSHEDIVRRLRGTP